MTNKIPSSLEMPLISELLCCTLFGTSPSQTQQALLGLTIALAGDKGDWVVTPGR